jgi:hypothetical protein
MNPSADTAIIYPGTIVAQVSPVQEVVNPNSKIVINAWQWVGIIDGYRIQTSVVYTEAGRSILLSHQDNRR